MIDVMFRTGSRSPSARALQVLLLMSCATCVPAAAQQAAPPVTVQVPRAHAQTMATALVAALNGKAADRERWIGAYVSPDGLRLMPKERWQRQLDRLASTYEGFEFAQWTGPESGRWYSIDVKVKGGKRVGHVRLGIDAAQPTYVRNIRLLPWPAFYDMDRQLQATTSATLKQAIAHRVDFATRHDDFSGAVLVVKGSEVLFQRAAGFAERDFGAPNKMNTRFNLGSMDKMFTATSIGQLIEAGKLSLDTRLIEVLPDYPNRDAAEKITIRHLLTHSAGLDMLWGRPKYDRLKPYAKVTELLDLFAAEPLLFAPGSKADYSNEGFIVLGAVIEKLSGMSYYDYVQANIFDRAGMKNTGYPRIDEIVADRAVGYRFGMDDPLGVGERRPNWNFDALGYRGNSCGGGYSTAADMVAFLQALRDGRLMSRSMAERMTAPSPQSIGNYGMGFEVEAIGHDQLRGHDGGGAFSGVNSFTQMLWNSGHVVAVMGNYDAPFIEHLGMDLAKIVERASTQAIASAAR